MKIFDIIPQKSPARPQPPPQEPATVPKLPPATEEIRVVESEPAREEASVSIHDVEQPAAPRPPKDRFDVLASLGNKEERPPLIEELRKKVRRRLMAPAWLILAGVLILGSVGVLTFLYPRVTVSISAKKADVPLEFFLTLEGKIKEAALTEGKIPGKFFTLERETTRSFSVSGKEKVTAKARGTLTVFNAFSAKPQTLVATTRFEAPNGKIFRLSQAATVPGAVIGDGKTKPASVAVAVEADKAGPTYNIGPADFTIPGFKGTTKFTGFYGKSSEAMKGGAEGETSVVKEQDLTEARRRLREELTAALNEELGRTLPEGWQTLPESVKSEIVTATPSVAPGTAADAFQMRFKLQLNAAAYRQPDLELVLGDRLKKISGGLEQKNVRLGTLRAEEPRLDTAKETLAVLVKASVHVETALNAQEIKQAILGKGETALKEYLGSHAGVETAKVTFWPFWVKRVPRREGLVTVTID